MTTARSLRLAGHTLVTLRQRRGWTQEKLAVEADVNRNTVARMESGIGVYPKSARRVAEALGVPLEDLLAAEPGLDRASAIQAAEEMLAEAHRMSDDLGGQRGA